jgi:hypothetical protein
MIVSHLFFHLTELVTSVHFHHYLCNKIYNYTNTCVQDHVYGGGTHPVVELPVLARVVA